jgi:hypothetical protein
MANDNDDKNNSELTKPLTAVVLILLGGATTAGGVGWWVHPGAGVAIMGATMLAVGIMVGLSE